jgi:serine/threonine-protein kinase
MAAPPPDLIARLNAALESRYRVVREIGQGGMALVFLARDVRHNRNVALKVLKPELARVVGAERFLSEIETMARLQHPHILPLFDSGEADGFLFFVMPHVDGESLRARLDREGQLPIGEAVAVAAKVAGALDHAHEHGVIHRDVKPANILLHGGEPLVADFGIALAVGAAGGDRLTETGTSLGTPSYMSPEQATGDPRVGPATDVWALACVLHETLIGEPPYTGSSGRAILSRIVTEAAGSVRERRSTVPVHVDAAIRRGLEKVPADRFVTAGDFARALGDPGFRHAEEASVRPPLRGSLWNPISVGAVSVAALALVVSAWGLLGGADDAPAAVVSRLQVDVRPAEALLGSNPLELSLYGRSLPSRTAIALSPDGRTLAFTARRGDRQSLYVRPLDSEEAIEVPGTEGADGPVFSPDGRHLAYWASGALWKVSLEGGPPVRVADSPLVWGTQWTESGRIVFAQRSGIWSVESDGGDRTQLTSLAQDGTENLHALPELLPGGEWLLYTVLPVDFGWDQARVVAQSLRSGERRTLVEGAAHARYVSSGHLVYLRLGNLMAAPFDPAAAELTGGEAGVVERVLQSVNRGSVGIDSGAGQYVFASNGTLAYVRGEIVPDFEGELLWIGRDGSEEEIPMAPPSRPFFAPRLSPDGRSLAVGTFGLRDHSIFRYDFATGALSRLTFSGWATLPVWTPDGTRLAINLAEAGARNLFTMPSEGGEPERLDRSPALQAPSAWSPDGRQLVFVQSGNVYLWSQDADPAVRPLLATEFLERHADLSPDGRWLAYVSNETGRSEVYVASFPGLEIKRPVSARGGVEPAWSGDGRTLAFLEPLTREGQGYRVVAAAVTTGDSFSSGPPRELFEVPWYSGGLLRRAYDVSADGQRFLFTRELYPPTTAEADRIHLVLNWFGELRERVPVR